MYIAGKEDIYYIDETSEKKYGIPTATLMENAGKNSFLWIKKNISDYRQKYYVVFCAHGNNGGDGAVLARYLASEKINFTVVLLGDVIGKSKEVARSNFLKLVELKPDIIEWDLKDEKTFDKIRECLKKSDIIIDAIFGIGFSGEIFQPFARVVEEINKSCKTVISLDIPSGVPANGGKFNLAVKADYTLTFGFTKFGMIDYPGANFAGKVEVIDIGIPGEILNERKLARLITDEYAKSLYKKRERDSHKGKYGHLLIIGGYGGDFKGGIKAMCGSVVLAGLAAMKVGVGLTTIAVSENVLHSVQALIPEAMTFGWGSNYSVKNIKKLIENNLIRTVLIGNGFSKGRLQSRILEMVLDHPIVNKIVIDADGLNIIVENRKLLDKLVLSTKDIILTPHIGEAARLLRLHPDEVKYNKLEAVKKLVSLTNQNVILKDSVSLISDRSFNIFINNRGSVVLAKGGSGDILAGIVAGLFASGYDSISSLCLGSYILGVAGEMCESEMGEVSPLGRDILQKIPEVIKSISKQELKQ